MEVVLVPTTHWDREWYRTFQAFRARLVDTVDRVLELLDDDPDYRFLLDGQSIVPEDYVEIRPGRRVELENAVRDGRVAIGPWYVQPDSLIPTGETHVRNLLEGRRAGEAFGPVSRVAYTPDSFGHPTQFPQLFRGFGLTAFVYWRGNADEIIELPAEYAWEAPDGTRMLACHLWKGYFNAAGLPEDVDDAVDLLRKVVEELGARTEHDRALLLAGVDHQLPEARTKAVCEALAAATGWDVRRGLLEDFVDGLTPDGLPTFRGELLGGRIANLLPGVWSTRTYLKLQNRACETALTGWAEPWTALGAALGTPDERPALRSAWRTLLENQAHDSICGCSQDAVHEQMLGRFDAARELAEETTCRILDRVAGLGPERRTPWSDDLDVAVFNPSPHPRTDVVRLPLDGHPMSTGGGEDRTPRFHPLVWANLGPKRFEADGRPARLVADRGGRGVRLVPEQEDWSIEFVAADVPAFGWKRVQVRAVDDDHTETVDDGREVEADDVRVRAADDGTLDVDFGETRFVGLGAIEDTGDRGDTYDYDFAPGAWETTSVEIQRFRHPGGIQRLVIVRTLSLPAGLTDDREGRSLERVEVPVRTEVRVAPGVPRVDLHIAVDNTARDHRLRLLFPTGRPCERFRAATTFDVCERTTASRTSAGWRHPAPDTFPHQGWVSANDLTVCAPGLLEGEVTPEGTIAVTLLRSVGWLSRLDLRSRPEPAGPSLPTPRAQCLHRTETSLSLFAGDDARAAGDAELGLWARPAGRAPLVDDDSSLVALEPRELVLSALKPAEDGDGVVLRVLNPTDEDHVAVIRSGFPIDEARSVALDESPDDSAVEHADGELRFSVPPRALRSVRLLSHSDLPDDRLR